ncbi:TonB-dependent receptor [Granulicella sp. 5B5]|uniref:TonB-dependent receptor n=1 Tax=Granulicella sp. 5B5 TaxID=1617967 RepID=UPI0015F41FE5|nr:TonB-dependent receptor [Granulicella sp. 5B5]
MRKLALQALVLSLLLTAAAYAAIFGQIHGVVHDPQHRPIAGATVELHAANSAFTQSTNTAADGSFTFSSIPLGDYSITVGAKGFGREKEALTLASDTSPILHLELPIAAAQETVTVSAAASNINTVTPTTLVDRTDIAETPGADRSNSMAMITDYTPGAYMTHDMLHMRGGHQVSWLIDGVEIPNTNIASNLAAQISPRDIDYLEVQRGSYSADTGDRTYGVFNVVPRTGFERDREAELVLTAGNFAQTDDQLNFGDHTEKLAYYASLSGNRSDYGLAPPIGQVDHDATNGAGGFASLIYNRTPHDQFRLVSQLRHDFFQIPYDPDPNDFENQQYDSSGLRDSQNELDGLTAFSWLHTFNASTVFQVSPFLHYNRADYNPNPNDQPTATTDNRSSTYAGAQITLNTVFKRNDIEAGIYSFGQHDNYFFGVTFNDGSGTAPIAEPDSANGGVVEEFITDNYKATDWLTIIAGLRQSHFQGAFSENYTDPRVGLAIRIPRLNWVFRGFYGRFYQPPPLVTAAGPVLAFANANNTALVPLHGERDEEHQFGVQIPYKGWLLDADTFKTRINNFLDHSNIGDSSIYFPVTVDGALVRAWELTLRSPRLWHFGQAHLAYSNQIAEQRGNITGGLICTPIGDPACDAGFDYTPVDHDQRNTLNVGFNASLPWHAYASTNVYYGSGFVNGDPDPTTPYPNGYLPQHTTFDLSVGKNFGERFSVSLTDANAANRRVLLDNSLTFGGFHFNDPRQYYGEVRYRFKY